MEFLVPAVRSIEAGFPLAAQTAVQQPGLGLPTNRRMTDEFAGVHAAEMTRELPDPIICRAKPSGVRHYADLVHCLVEHPRECPHVLRFGAGNYCQHPQRHDIVQRTVTLKLG